VRHFILIVLLFFFTTAHALSANDSKKSLENINNTINKIQKDLHTDKQKKNKLEQVLKETEIIMGELDKDLNDLNTKINKEKKALALLNQKAIRYENKLKLQQKALSGELSTLYFLHNHNYLKTLLSQSDSNTFSRNITYFKYFNRSRLHYMQKINHTMDDIKKNKALRQEQTQSLKKKLQDKKSKQQQLTKLQQSRQQILTSLNDEISNKQQQLNTLKQNKARLETLLQDLSEAKQTPIQPPLPFNKMKGKLVWPTKGNISKHFNESIDNSQLKTTGVVISAPKGQNIHAIYPGKVVFADWLKGFGLLVIIDHGDGYLSLYGRNNSLYQKTGDFVNQDDVIASVGNSGGYQQSGLYFEIRRNGNPLNPEVWCHSK